jgi:hypothetical protein
MTDHLAGVIAILFAGLCGVGPFIIGLVLSTDHEALWQFAMNLLAGWTT